MIKKLGISPGRGKPLQNSPTNSDQRRIANHLKRGALLYWAALLTIGASAIHFMDVPKQGPQSALLAALLLSSAVIQAVTALAIVTVPARRLLIAAMVIESAAVVFWLTAHSIGLPIGFTLWRPEMLSVFDLFLPVMELLSVLLLLRLIVRRPQTRAHRAWRTALATLPALLLVSFLTTGIINAAAGEVWLSSSSTISAPAGQTTTLAYCSPDGNPLAMDLSEPPAQAPRPAPVVFNIHGGGGFFGARQLAGLDVQLRNELLSRGFVVGSIDYRLAPLYRADAQIEDAKCAVRFLRAHASELGIDPKRIGVYGGSQGGYLAAMLGTTGRGAGFDVGQYLNQSSRVQAVVDMWGFTDLTNLSGSPSWANSLVQIEFGSSVADQRVHSPITYVAPGDPPFLILHGTDDPFSGLHQSSGLAQRLHVVGVPATLVLVQHGTDSLDAPTPGFIQQPSPDALMQMICDFFARTLAA